jgi:tetratricopeptide (TPR) repeat protein
LQWAGNLAAALGDLPHAVERFEQALALPHAADDARWRIRVLALLGETLGQRGDSVRAVEYLTEALDAARETGSPRSVALILWNLASMAISQGDLPRAEAFADEMIATGRTAGDDTTLVQALELRVSLAFARGDVDQAERALRQGLSIVAAAPLGHPTVLSHLRLDEAVLERLRGNDDRAAALLQAWLPGPRAAGDRASLALALLLLAGVVGRRGHWSLAARWYGAAEGWLAQTGSAIHRDPSVRCWYDSDRAEAIDHLDPAIWDQQRRQGQRLTIEAAIDEALAVVQTSARDEPLSRPVEFTR